MSRLPERLWCYGVASSVNQNSYTGGSWGLHPEELNNFSSTTDQDEYIRADKYAELEEHLQNREKDLLHMLHVQSELLEKNRQTIDELEEHLKSARNDGFDMCKADYREQFAEYDERIAELEEQLMFFLEDWDHCTELGFCPEMGYLKEDWCPWCKTRRLLGLPDARNWEEHLENET